MTTCPALNDGLVVGGLGRSGTTLFTALLDNHQQLLVLNEEVRFFREIARGLRTTTENQHAKYVEAYLRGRFQSLVSYGFKLDEFLYHVSHYVENWTRLRDIYIGIIMAYGAATGNQDWRYWIEKTPGNHKFLDRYLKWFPSCRLIVLSRDPRAVFVSIVNNGQKRSAVLSAEEFSEAWKKAYESRIHAESLTPTLSVRYEDLVLNTEGSMESVAKFIGIAWDSCFTQPSRLGIPWHGNSSFATASPRVHKDSLGRWRSLISNSDRAVIERELEKPMTNLGYES